MDCLTGVIIFGLVAVGLIITAFILRHQFIQQQKTVLKEINDLQGTRFPTTDEAFKTQLMGTGHTALAFDTSSRKICILRRNKSQVVDYSYVRKWRLFWKGRYETFFGIDRYVYDKVWIEVHTTDINEPILTIYVSSKDEGEQWVSRLGILL